MNAKSGWVTIFLLATTLSSCKIVYTSHSYKSVNDCAIHEKRLKKGIARTRFGLPNFGNVDAERARIFYPHARKRPGKGCVLTRFPKHRLSKIKYCTKCNSVRREMRRTEKTSGAQK